MAKKILLSDAERNSLREMYLAGVPYADLMDRMGYSNKVVDRELKAMGLRRLFRWTPAEDDVISARYGAADVAVWAYLLPGRPVQAIVNRARRLGLVSRLADTARWTSAEDEILTRNYGRDPVREWQHQLPDRTRHAILGRARFLGLRSNLRMRAPSRRQNPGLPASSSPP